MIQYKNESSAFVELLKMKESFSEISFFTFYCRRESQRRGEEAGQRKQSYREDGKAIDKNAKIGADSRHFLLARSIFVKQKEIVYCQ